MENYLWGHDGTEQSLPLHTREETEVAQRGEHVAGELGPRALAPLHRFPVGAVCQEVHDVVATHIASVAPPHRPHLLGHEVEGQAITTSVVEVHHPNKCG